MVGVTLHPPHPPPPGQPARWRSWGSRLPVQPPLQWGLLWSPHSLPLPHPPSWALGSDSNCLGLLRRCPTDVTSSMSQTRSLFPQLPPPPCPTWMMDWQLFLGLTLGPFSAARAACPKPILIPLALFKKPPLGSCCKGSLVPAHLNSGISSTHHVPLGPGDPYLVLREYPLVTSAGKLIPIHSVGRLAALLGQPLSSM